MSTANKSWLALGAAAAAGLGMALLWSRRNQCSGPTPNRGQGAKWLVLVMTQPNHKIMGKLPQLDDVEFLLGNAKDEFDTFSPTALAQADFLLASPSADLEMLLELWPQMTGIKWVHSMSAGVDKLKPFISQHLAHSAVPLTCGRGAFSASLAEYVLASALHFNKQFPRCEANRKAKIWDKFVMNTLEGGTMGFVGFGHIAQTAARLARAFGMKVLAIRKNPDRTSPLADETLGFDDASKQRLFEASDFVVCTLPDTRETRGFIGERELAAMKSTAVLISLGRGVVVDEVALNQALIDKTIAGAALDVFAVEPLPEDSPLWDRENALLTSHNADVTADFAERGWNTWRENLDLFVAGQPLATPVDKSAGY